MIEPRSRALTSSRIPPRHSGGMPGHRRPSSGPRWVRARFGRAAMAVASTVAVVAGVATGAALDGLEPPPPPSATQAEPVETAGPTLDSVPLTAAVTDQVLGRTSEREELPAEPAPLALPASPAPIDPDRLDADGLAYADRQAGLLTAAVPSSASGELVVVPGSQPAPAPDRTVRTVTVEVEAGLDVDPVLLATFVMSTLNDPRGWGGDGSTSFARTDGDADLRVVLASPALVDRLCAPLETVGKYSCGRNGHAALNYTRWVQATPEFADRTQYRQYLVNHEVGHLLGHAHLECPGPGERAPLMQQQSVSVAPCIPNGWPFPDVA